VHNSRQHNAGLHNAGATVTSSPRHATKKYRFEIRTAGGQLVAGLQDRWFDAQWTIEANAHDNITVALPYDSTLYSQAAYPNLLALNDQQGTQLQRFQILERETENTADGLPMIRISGPSLQVQLTDEIIEQYGKP